jgi:hypothetical protein
MAITCEELAKKFTPVIDDRPFPLERKPASVFCGVVTVVRNWHQAVVRSAGGRFRCQMISGHSA